MNFEKKLQQIPTIQAVFRSSKRIETFTAIDCITILSKSGLTAEEIKIGIQKLLREYKIFKINGDNDIVDFIPGQTMSISDRYAWTEEQTHYINLIYGILIIIGLLCLIMFPMWPWRIKHTVGYIKYPLFGFLIFILILGIIRLIIYGITLIFMSTALWIFPNLFAECGFFESFIPIYLWENSSTISHENSTNNIS